MDLDSLMSPLNSVIVAVLRSPLHWLLSAGLILITVTGRRTGRRYTIPVGCQPHDGQLIVMVSKARRKNWWRNYEASGPVEVLLKGTSRAGTAEVIPTDADEFRRYAESTFRRMPFLRGQFEVTGNVRNGLSDDQLAQLAANAAMVAIRLDDPS